MAQDKPRPPRGLASIAEARELRASRALPAASGKFWLWSLIAIVAMTIFYWRKTQNENDAFRARILAKQRAVASEHGGPFFSLRDRAEKWTMDLAKGTFEPDFIAPSLKDAGKEFPLFKKPGVYLRVPQEDARSPEKIRNAARESLRDAFTSCLLHTPHLTQHKGQACRVSKECPAGQICNEADVCSTPAQPFNLRLAYHGLRVLSDSWVRNVQSSGDSASDTLVLRRYEMDIDSATSNDLPVVTELLRKAEYFLVVVDEVPEGFQPPANGSVGQAIQSEPHPARIALYDLKSSELLLRLHRTADATVPAIPGDAETIDAQRRQILNCALAQEVRAALDKLAICAPPRRRPVFPGHWSNEHGFRALVRASPPNPLPIFVGRGRRTRGRGRRRGAKPAVSPSPCSSPSPRRWGGGRGERLPACSGLPSRDRRYMPW